MRAASHGRMEHGAAKYLFVTKGRVLAINNPDFGALAAYAGHTVKLTGELDQYGKITVSKIERPRRKKTVSSR